MGPRYRGDEPCVGAMATLHRRSLHRVADPVNHRFDLRRILALGHHADDGLGAHGRMTSRPLPSSSPSASAIAALTVASSSGLPPLSRTFLSNCGSGSKRWSSSLAGS